MSESDQRLIDEVIEVERRWVQVHRELDVGAIRQILADDYVQIRANGTVISKVEALQSYGSGKRRWDFADSDEYQVTVQGDVAILIGRWKGVGENDGERFDYASRFMAVYVQRDGAWHLAADQAAQLSAVSCFQS